MYSLDFDSLFTYIPLEEIINIGTNLLYNNEDVIEDRINLSLRTFCRWLLKNCISYLTVLFIDKRMAWPWDRPLHLLQQMFSCHFMNSNGLDSVQSNLNEFFTEDMLMAFLLYSNWLNTSQNFVIILIRAILTCLSLPFLHIEVSREKGKSVSNCLQKANFQQCVH